MGARKPYRSRSSTKGSRSPVRARRNWVGLLLDESVNQAPPAGYSANSKERREYDLAWIPLRAKAHSDEGSVTRL